MKEIHLSPQQQEAVSHKEGPMIVLSVAGSGKTMVLTERIIRLIEEGFDPSRLLAITFAKKAVLEIQSRLKKRLNGNGNKALVCTFHSLGYRILRREKSLGIGCRLVQEADQVALVRLALERVRLEDDPEETMRKISLAKNDLVSPSDLEGSTKPEEKNLAKVYTCYELLKRRKRLLDFDDLLYLPYQLFKAHAGILARYQNRFLQILIDEFQDSSRVMVELVKMLSQSHRNVWLAGDDDQSIHAFRGARSDIFVSFGKECGTDAKTITMSHNYRSTGKIIRAANNLISHNNNRVAKEMVTDNGEGQDIEILEGDNEIAEAEIVAQKIHEFLAHIEEAVRVNKSSSRRRVNLMTIHQAKGLEFRCVIVPGLNEGILPHVKSVEQVIMNIEEERRLMYVAMTRAMERLIITYRRRQTGEPITVASRFLKESAGQSE